MGKLTEGEILFLKKYAGTLTEEESDRLNRDRSNRDSFSKESVTQRAELLQNWLKSGDTRFDRCEGICFKFLGGNSEHTAPVVFTHSGTLFDEDSEWPGKERMRVRIIMNFINDILPDSVVSDIIIETDDNGANPTIKNMSSYTSGSSNNSGAFSRDDIKAVADVISPLKHQIVTKAIQMEKNFNYKQQRDPEELDSFYNDPDHEDQPQSDWESKLP